jgi:hypothetical protein
MSPATHKLGRKEQLAARDGEQAVDVFARRNATEQNYFAARHRGEHFSGSQQWFCEPRLIGVDRHSCEFVEFRDANVYICRK